MFTDEKTGIETRFVQQLHAGSPLFRQGRSFIVDAAAKTLKATDGISFITDGILPNTYVMMDGFAADQNNLLAFLVASVTADTLTLSDPHNLLTSETATGTASISYPSYPIGFENIDFTPPDTDKSYVTCYVVAGKGEQMSIGQSPLIRYLGFIQNSVYTPGGQGTSEARVIADRIAAIWRLVQFNVGTNDTISCEVPTLATRDYRTLSRTGSQDGRYRVDVTTPFRRDVQF